MSQIGPYALGELLGQGGAARVHRATDQRDGRAVVVKCAPVADGIDEKRFLREAAILTRLSHPHLVRCLDVGRAENLLYMVMEDLKAETLEQRVKRGRPAEPELIRWLAHILMGLEALHAQRVVHRDVKPSNLLIGADGQLRVADLGLAFQEDGEQLTGSAAVVGSPEWYPAEVLTGSRADQRGDLYQWALVAYWLVAGTLPFPGESPLAASSRRCYDPIPPLSSVNRACAPLLSDLVERNLSPTPEHRHAEARELLADLMMLWPAERGPISKVS